MKTRVMLVAITCACDAQPVPPAPVVPVVPVAQMPAAAAPQAQAVGPVAPGQYVNHIGNPAAGYWGPQGQWQWHNPQGAEANNTWKYLAVAGLTGGATYLFTKAHYDREHRGRAWSQDRFAINNDSYLDHRGTEITRDQYMKRRNNPTYIDRRGKTISAAEFHRRRAQSRRDKARHQERRARSKLPYLKDHKTPRRAQRKNWKKSRSARRAVK